MGEQEDRDARHAAFERRIRDDARRMLRAAYGEAFHERIEPHPWAVRPLRAARLRERLAEWLERFADRVRGF